MEPQVQEIFKMLDYQSFQMEELMDEFLIRYQAYYNDVDLFPHEIGKYMGICQKLFSFLKNIIRQKSI